MFSEIHWNQPVCPSVCVSVYPSMSKILVSVKVLAGYEVTFSDSSSFCKNYGLF